MAPGCRRWTTALVRDMRALTDVQLEVCGTARWEARCAGKGKQWCVKEMWKKGSWGSLYLSLRTVGKLGVVVRKLPSLLNQRKDTLCDEGLVCRRMVGPLKLCD